MFKENTARKLRKLENGSGMSTSRPHDTLAVIWKGVRGAKGVKRKKNGGALQCRRGRGTTRGGGLHLVRAPENLERPAVQREEGLYKPRAANCAGNGDPTPVKSQREKRGDHQRTPRGKREGARLLAGRARAVHRGVGVLVEAGTAQGARGALGAEKAAGVAGGGVLNRPARWGICRAAALARAAGAAVDLNPLAVGKGAEGPCIEPVAFGGGRQERPGPVLAGCICGAQHAVACLGRGAEVPSAADSAFRGSFPRRKARTQNVAGRARR